MDPKRPAAGDWKSLSCLCQGEGQLIMVSVRIKGDESNSSEGFRVGSDGKNRESN